MCGYVIELSLRLAHASNSVPIKECQLKLPNGCGINGQKYGELQKHLMIRSSNFAPIKDSVLESSSRNCLDAQSNEDK
ncbi:hypothetical protein T12_6878 [Trichinella patagoniensis]|uniref:Uncharacterized protein n=1 Tax=Trichinella patagoniensis TaxID=990121 RepID=A0A0V0ZWQ0_9BILA|nr:hypothetical protein T12_6878 [Trichinella patagoniensis]